MEVGVIYFQKIVALNFVLWLDLVLPYVLAL